MKHRILQLNCLFNSYNVVIPWSILYNSVSMLKKNTLVPFEPIPTLRFEAMRSLSLETSNFATYCLFNNYNVFIPRPMFFNSISMLKTNTPVQFEPILRVFDRILDPKPSLSLSNKFWNAVTT